MKKGRAGLIFSISVGLTAILTASVSTYAWFQASASATVTGTSKNATVTVAAPDDVHLEDPVLFKYKENGTMGYTGAMTGTSITDATNTYFEKCASFSDLNSVTDLMPGKKMSFAIRAHSTAVGGTKGTLALTFS